MSSFRLRVRHNNSLGANGEDTQVDILSIMVAQPSQEEIQTGFGMAMVSCGSIVSRLTTGGDIDLSVVVGDRGSSVVVRCGYISGDNKFFIDGAIYKSDFATKKEWLEALQERLLALCSVGTSAG